MRAVDDHPVEWMVTHDLVAYEAACAFMAQRVEAIAAGTAPELVWLLEHPPLYTAGTSAKTADLIEPNRLPVYKTGRGGEFTYHGPGQRVGYLMLDVRRRWGGVREFVTAIEELIIDAVGALGLSAHTRKGLVGVWVGAEAAGAGAPQEKIAAIGVRLRHWISSHGFSINVAPDLSHFTGIVPCGIREDGVTSLSALGADASMAEVDAAIRAAFERRIAPTRAAAHASPDVTSLVGYARD